MLSSFWRASLDSKSTEVFEANSLGALKAKIVEYYLERNMQPQQMWSVDLVYGDGRLSIYSEALDHFNNGIAQAVLDRKCV